MENAKCRREFGIFCAEKRKCCGFCDLLRGKCEMPQGIRSFRTEKAKCYAESRIFHTEGQQRSAEFRIFCAEKAKCCTEFGIFGMEKAKCCEEFWIFCAERAKFRSDCPILSLAAAKSSASVSTPARFPKFEGVTAIYSVSANFPSQKSGSPAGIRRGSPPGRNRKPNLRRAARVSLFPNKKCERPGGV